MRSLRLAFLLTVLVLAGLGAGVVVAPSAATSHVPDGTRHLLCSAGYVDAIIGGEHKCLHAGEFCASSHESDYRHYGFSCVDGHLQTFGGGQTTTTTSHGGSPVESEPLLGHTVSLSARTQTHGCTRGVLPDRQCSPGAYYSGLTKAVLCSPSFRTGTIRDVPESEKHAVEVEYGMAPKSYGRTIEIDHIISLEIGGSNDISNLFPEPGSGPANYHVKDKLENKLHALVCSGAMTLHAAQAGISSNWETLYTRVFGDSPLA